MPNHQVATSLALLSCVCLLPGCGDVPGGTDLGESTAQADERFSTTPREPNHEEITRVALDFLRPEILTALVAANVSTDVEFVLVNANHFDDCNFSGGSLVVAASEAEAVRSLDPSLALADGDALALLSFGRALHALQDFYAHTNWVELGGEMLVDASLNAFPKLSPYSTIASSGFVVIQGSKPKTTALVRREDAPYPDNAVVTLKAGKSRALALISGTVDYEPGNFCPASVAMTHDELNKDRSDLGAREAQHAAAKALAISQTRHEWCRLGELSRASWGDAGKARLSTWVADGATEPNCTVE